MRIVAFGECMLELSGGFGEGAHLGFGGDTLNTALYLARLGAKVSYATALGHDSWSQEMRRAWSEEGIALDLVLTDPQRLPGLYAIQTDAGGERRFSYWRTNSAARHFFELPGAEQLLRIISTADLFYVSGISLSLYGDAERARLLDVAYAVRIHGGDVAFDPNYRPAGWSSPDQARSAFDLFTPAVSVALPTFEDERLLRPQLTPETAARRWLATGAREVALKLGEAGALVADEGQIRHVRAVAVSQPIDTTGAGDAFNAGYLFGRSQGQSPHAAAALGAAIAAKVICHRGGIAPRAATQFQPVAHP